MSKNQTVTINSNSFCFTQLRSECRFPSITVDFTAPPSVNKVSNSIMPVFLADNNFFTPAFIVSREKEYYGNNFFFEKEKFYTRISKANSLCKDSNHLQQNTLQISPPIPTSNYCQICKTGFTSYEDHLKEGSHDRQSRLSKINKQIKKLCKKYRSRKQENKIKKKNKIQKKIKKENKYDQKIKTIKLIQQTIQLEIIHTLKYHNYSTNVPSIMPTQYS